MGLVCKYLPLIRVSTTASPAAAKKYLIMRTAASAAKAYFGLRLMVRTRQVCGDVNCNHFMCSLSHK